MGGRYTYSPGSLVDHIGEWSPWIHVSFPLWLFAHVVAAHFPMSSWGPSSTTAVAAPERLHQHARVAAWGVATHFRACRCSPAHPSFVP